VVYKKPLLSILMLIASTIISYSQKTFPQHYFISPLNIKPVVSGTFGELRSDHFHSGIDFATQNKTNANVYCVADGYVSRIKVSSTGYGRAIYVTHPNGFVSVYAHLSEYNVVVEDYVKLKQYEKKSFEIELFPNPALFRMKKGDIIGYSGNTGASSGPHLHFELRNQVTERPFNPLFFGYKIPDETSPEISGVYFYPISPNSTVDHNQQKICLDIIKKGSSFALKTPDTIILSGGIAFGVDAADKQDFQGSNGIYSLEIFVDNQPFYKISFDSIDFDEGRYINTLIDYPQYILNGKRIIQTYKSYGNRLNIYSRCENRGVFIFSDTLIHTIRMVVSDFNKNSAAADIPVRSEPPGGAVQSHDKNTAPLFRFGLKNHFEKENMVLDLPSDALYDSIYFDYAVFPRLKTTFASIHRVHNKLTPLHTFITLNIKPDTTMTKYLMPKLTLAYVYGKSFSYVKSKWENGFLSGRIRKFGDYTIVADTIAPVIKPSINYDNRKISSGDIVSFKITDDFSGINSYNLSINGKWVLAEYDQKNDLLFYKADPSHFTNKTNILELVVTDNLENKTTYKVTLLY